MNTPKPGDRIRLIHMPDDPDPIKTGAMGTVTAVRLQSFGPRPFELARKSE
jgi:hypothetical protein